MNEILIHKSANYIEEDRDYYYSDTRDKHGMIQPSDDMVSVTCDSKIFKSNPTNQEICSIYYPFEKESFHRIYLGISFPLFANNWGAAFLRHLMYLIEPDGGVILPVYAERQGVEKNYWSRSSLEVIFQSRQKWWGMSNIWAENDGVMSMRIGKKQPPKKNSALNYFLENMSKTQIDESPDNHYKNLLEQHENGINSAIIEQVIINTYGRKKPISLCNIHGDSLLSSELLMSDYINIQQATQVVNDDQNIKDFNKYLVKDFDTKLKVISHSEEFLNLHTSFDVICMINIFENEDDNKKLEFIKSAFSKLNKEGCLIIKDTIFNDEKFINKIKSELDGVDHNQYSSIVATKHNKNTNIAHYSDIIFSELQSENEKRNDTFNILQKK